MTSTSPATRHDRFTADLRDLAESVSASGRVFFEQLATFLARALGVEYVLVGELTGEDSDTVRTLAMSVGGGLAGQMHYPLAGTPCQNVVGQRLCHYPTGVQAMFPTDRELAELKIDSYMGTPLFDARGRPLGLIVLMHTRSIDDPAYAESLLRVVAKRAEVELERSRHDAERERERGRIEAVLRQLPAGVVIVEAPSGNLLMANEQVQPLLRGLSLSAGVLDASERVEGYRPDGRRYAADEWPLVRALTRNEVISGEEVELVRGDGSRGFLSVSAAPVRDPDGRVTAAVATFFDITDRRRAEERIARGAQHAALRADVAAVMSSGGEFSDVLKGCTDALVRHLDAAFARIWTLNTAENVLELRASSGLYTHVDGPHGRVPVGKFKIGLIAEERRPHLTNEVVGDPRVGDQEWARREGMVSFAGYPLVVDGTLVGVMALFARHALPDDTLDALASVALTVAQGIERRRREEELARSNAELEQFAYVASHDLQEPLRVIVSYLQLLQRRYQGQLDASGEKYIAYSVGAAERLKRLINDLLSYSRVGRKELGFRSVDANRLVGEVLEDLRAAAAESGAEITRDPLPTVVAEPEQLRQVFLNLIGNALKFRGDRAPRVHISAQPHEGAWRFAVRDNGIGIDPSFSQRIFLIFQRLHGRHEYPGTGIGLALCKKIVERHGGQIWVESVPESGSTFYFTLPNRSTTT